MANQEIIYYFERLFEPIVVATMRRHIARLSTQYELFPAVNLSSRNKTAIADAQDSINKQMYYRFNEVRTVLEGTRKRFAPGQEIVKRPKLGTVVPAETAYMTCQVKGCCRVASLVDGKCPDCEIYRCSHREHFSHANHSQFEIENSSGGSIVDPSIIQAATRGGRGRRRGGRGGGRGERRNDASDVIAVLQEQVRVLQEKVFRGVSEDNTANSDNN